MDGGGNLNIQEIEDLEVTEFGEDHDEKDRQMMARQEAGDDDSINSNMGAD